MCVFLEGVTNRDGERMPMIVQKYGGRPTSHRPCPSHSRHVILVSRLRRAYRDSRWLVLSAACPYGTCQIGWRLHVLHDRLGSVAAALE